MLGKTYGYCAAFISISLQELNWKFSDNECNLRHILCFWGAVDAVAVFGMLNINECISPHFHPLADYSNLDEDGSGSTFML